MVMTERDIAYLVKGVPGIAAATGVENAEQTGPWIRRDDPILHLSCVAAVLVDCPALTNGESFSIAAQLDDADDDAGTNSAVFGDPATPEVVSNTGGAPAAFSGVLNYGVDLSGAREFVRIRATVTPSNGTDACNMAGIMVLGGGNKRPAP